MVSASLSYLWYVQFNPLPTNDVYMCHKKSLFVRVIIWYRLVELFRMVIDGNPRAIISCQSCRAKEPRVGVLKGWSLIQSLMAMRLVHYSTAGIQSHVMINVSCKQGHVLTNTIPPRVMEACVPVRMDGHAYNFLVRRTSLIVHFLKSTSVD